MGGNQIKCQNSKHTQAGLNFALCAVIKKVGRNLRIKCGLS